MIRTEYYKVNHVKGAIRKYIDRGLIDEKKDELPIDGPDELYLTILDFVESFLTRNKCSIDVLEFFENYEEIRCPILDAISNPEEADASSAILASMEFGKLIAECKSPYHIFAKEFRMYEEEESRKRFGEPYSPLSAFGQLGSVPPNPFSIDNYGKPYVNK